MKTNQALPQASEVFYGRSNSSQSKSYQSKLRKLGLLGQIAAELLQAAKSEERSSTYRGGTERVQFAACSTDRQDKAIRSLHDLLSDNDSLIAWGWLPERHLGAFIICVETPVGQISRMFKERLSGPLFLRNWDRDGLQTNRILKLCDHLLRNQAPAIGLP